MRDSKLICRCLRKIDNERDTFFLKGMEWYRLKWLSGHIYPEGIIR